MFIVSAPAYELVVLKEAEEEAVLDERSEEDRVSELLFSLLLLLCRDKDKEVGLVSSVDTSAARLFLSSSSFCCSSRIFMALRRRCQNICALLSLSSSLPFPGCRCVLLPPRPAVVLLGESESLDVVVLGVFTAAGATEEEGEVVVVVVVVVVEEGESRR